MQTSGPALAPDAPNGQIVVTFDWTEDRFLAACNRLWAYRAIGRLGNYLTAGGLGALGLLLIWQGVPGWLHWVLLPGSAGILALSLARDQIWRSHFRGARMFAAPVTVILDEDGVGTRTAEGESFLRWSQFAHYVLTPDYLYLLVDRRRFSIIPFSAFPDLHSRARAEALVTSKLKRLRRRIV